MEAKAIAPLAVLLLPSACRLLPSACSPDKDLVALISRLGGKDRLSLWKMQGSKKWEVDVGLEENTSSESIVGLAWSPGGQSIAVAHDPPRVTLHSVQDGHEERTLHISVPFTSPRHIPHVTGIWWFQNEKPVRDSIIPDIFRRNNIITGTAHSILKILPLLDHLADDAQKTTATDLFAFQGSQTRSSFKASLPEVVQSWPTLHPHPLTASMSPSLEGISPPSTSTDSSDSEDVSNLNSILAVSDDLGHIHYLLDGSYPLGVVSLGSESSIASTFKDPTRPMFFAHPQMSVNDVLMTDLYPVIIELPLLDKRDVRDLATLSSTARALTWYTMRVVKDMRAVWFGSEAFGGARELGPKWIRSLENMQTEKFGLEEANPMLDLTRLLVTGRASEPIHEFIGGSQMTSERGIQKWEMTVVDALVKLRDFSEKRVAPACQRLHLVLEEIQGWSHLPQYTLFELASNDIRICLELSSRAIVISSWLAAVARRELLRFKEFIKWLTFASAILRETADNAPAPRHDVLEVNNYFMSGLVVSSIDKWFMGPVPRFSPQDLGVPGDKQNLAEVLERARCVINSPSQIAWQHNIKQQDLSHLDRNLDALIQELATRCQRVFSRAASAVARSAAVTSGRDSLSTQGIGARPSHGPSSSLIIRERIIRNETEAGTLLQCLAIQMTSGDRTFLCLTRRRYGKEACNVRLPIEIALLECRLPEAQEALGMADDFDLLEADFFDDESIVVVFRLRGINGPTFLATVGYKDLGYQELRGEHVAVPSREDLALNVMQQWKASQIYSIRIPIKRSRELEGCKIGGVSLAMNGRVGRRVTCVLDNKGTTMEILDLEGDWGSEEEGAIEGERDEAVG